MVRFEIRGATPEDEDELCKLARFLNSVNLPDDRAHIQRLLAHADRSFRGEIPQPSHRKYVFVLWDTETGEAVGTSMIVAQLGRRDAPYIYFDVLYEEKYSSLLDKYFHHTALRLGFSYDGPTELGGLVVAPQHRASKARLGILISFVRFLYIAMRRDVFQDELLAELLPPLESDGTSHLWEALGRRFTEMSYADADLLSSENKEFIRDLFPTGMLYASLLSPEAQAVIGKVGGQTRGVEKMLKRVGFRYAERVDPFDGGPHFVAETDEVTLIRDAELTSYAGTPAAPLNEGKKALIGRILPHAPWFLALPSAFEHDKVGLRLPAEAAARLELTPGASVGFLPL